MEWSKPKTYGDAYIEKYLLRLDGCDYADVNRDMKSYVFSSCEPGTIYTFELQVSVFVCAHVLGHKVFLNSLSLFFQVYKYNHVEMNSEITSQKIPSLSLKLSNGTGRSSFSPRYY